MLVYNIDVVCFDDILFVIASEKKLSKNCIEKLKTLKLFMDDTGKVHADMKNYGCMLCFVVACLVMKYEGS